MLWSFLSKASQVWDSVLAIASKRPAAGTCRTAFDERAAATTSRSSSARRLSSADTSHSWSGLSSSSSCETACAFNKTDVELHRDTKTSFVLHVCVLSIFCDGTDHQEVIRIEDVPQAEDIMASPPPAMLLMIMMGIIRKTLAENYADSKEYPLLSSCAAVIVLDTHWQSLLARDMLL